MSVVVAFSVIVQGSLVPYVARRARIAMEEQPLTPWEISIRLEREPRGLRRFLVRSDAPAADCAVRDLPLGETAWVTLVVHDGEAVQPRGDYVLRPHDEVLVLSDPAAEEALRRLFERTRLKGGPQGQTARPPEPPAGAHVLS